MEKIVMMEVELQELERKIEKGIAFVEKETLKPSTTDNWQRLGLSMQLGYMKQYAEMLAIRIEYDKGKM